MITASSNGVYLEIHVQPRARRPGVRGVHDHRLKIAVSEPAAEGKANRAAIATVAGLLQVGRGAVSIESGRSSRRKRLLVRGIDAEDAVTLIETALEAAG